MLKFRVHQRISVIDNFASNTLTVLQYHVVSILQATYPWENEDAYPLKQGRHCYLHIC